ncbi:uncharacterized protein [Amphiura filiformis]|uniref:uncharacterized protein n=1 Tax=Amphiura filiformis TaxID=82378 RepID=UPI003B2164F3
MTSQKIPFHSPDGQKLLAQSDTTHQPHLIKLFKKQIGAKTCGIQSAALLLSARHLGNHGNTSPDNPSEHDDTNLPYTETNMFSYKETNHVIVKKVLEQSGCSLNQLHSLFISHGFKASIHHSDAITVETFRSTASKALSHTDSKCGVIVNYVLAALGQDVNGKGHFSPLAGYNQSKDMFLLLDTWWNTQDVWVKTEFLYEAMCTVDSASGKARGFIILEQ